MHASCEARQVHGRAQIGDRVEVTGSSIKRIDAETALPVQLISRQDIQRLAPQNVEDLLKTVSASNGVNGMQLSAGSSATTGGISISSLQLSDHEVVGRAIDQRMYRLRHRLVASGASRDAIRSVRGRGFVLADTVADGLGH